MLLILMHFCIILSRSIVCFLSGNDTNVSLSHPDQCENSTFNIFPACYCDSQCAHYGDCCFAVQYPVGETAILNTTKICERNSYIGHISYWTVTSCAEEVIEESHNDVQIPVVDEDGTVYTNDQIAQCNNARASPMDIFVRLTADTCAVNSVMALVENSLLDLLETILNSNCYFAFVPNGLNKMMNTFPRYCIDWPERYVSKYLSVRCQVYQKPIKVASVVFKNEYCLEDVIGNSMTDRNGSFTDELYPVPFENDMHLQIQFQKTFEFSTLNNKICADSNQSNCHTRSIKNWKQKLEVTLGSTLPIHMYHVKYSSIFFLNNFLKNNLNLTFDDKVYVYTLSDNQTTPECHPVFISITVKSERGLSEKEMRDAVNFLDKFKVSSFSSTINFLNGSNSDINSFDCKLDEESKDKLHRKQRVAFKVGYLKSIMKYLSDLTKLNTESYCPGLFVESKERENKKYIDIFLYRWNCRWTDKINRMILNAPTFTFYIIIVGCISAITIIVSFVTVIIVKRFPKH